jgi:chloramphenicol-sensitive protein RarD
VRKVIQPPTALSQKAILAAASAYIAWGFFALYWKYLQRFPSIGIICHRVIWTCFFYGIVWFAIERKNENIFPSRRNLLLCLGCGSMISFNWLLFLYSVNSNQLLEGSLAYFINPLLNILLGALVYGERLGNVRKIAVAVATLGVALMAIRGGHIPFLALGMAFSFSIYGAFKKSLQMNVFHSAWLETLMVLPIAVLGAVYFYQQGVVVPAPFEWALLIGGGLITGVPMIWFAMGARDLPYSLMGFLQFLSPTLQFALAIFLFGEVLTEAHIWAFSLIWVGVALYIWSLFSQRRL